MEKKPSKIIAARAAILAMGSARTAQAGPDQPWMDSDQSDASGLLLFGILLFAGYQLVRAFPVQVAIFVGAALVAWIASFLVGDAGGMLVGAGLLVWLLR